LCLHLWLHCDCIVSICNYSYGHIVIICQHLCSRFWWHIGCIANIFFFAYYIIITELCTFVFTRMFTWKLYCVHFVLLLWLHYDYCQHWYLLLWSHSEYYVCISVSANDNIVSVLSAFMFKLWPHSDYCLHLCLRLWSHNVCVVCICVLAYDHIKTVLSTFLFFSHDHIVTLLSTFVFTLMIILWLHCQHLFSRFWSHSNCIVTIYVHSYNRTVAVLWALFYIY